MEIKPSAQTNMQGLQSQVEGRADLTRLFPPGQIIEGVIEKVSQKSLQQNTPSLFEIIINSNGKRIATESRQPLVAGQLVKLEVMSDASLKLLQIIERPVASLQNLIQKGLRESLPLQQNHSTLLNRLAPLESILGRLNLQTENQPLLKAQLQLRQLLTSLPNRDQLQNPAQLKQAMTNSGSFLEAKLQKIIQQFVAPPQQKAQNQSQPEQSIRALLKTNSALAKQLEPAIGKDLKGQLVRLAATLAPLSSTPATGNPSSSEMQLIARIVAAATAGNTPAKTQQSVTSQKLELPELPLNTQITRLLQQAGIKPAPQQTSMPRESFDLAISTLLRQIASSIANIQNNQFASIANRQPSTESQLVNSWYVEIPAFNEGQFRPIQIQIDEETTGDQGREEKKGRQWKITLGFDFDDLGEFFATLTIVENSISATFWSEQPQTLERIKNELNYLERSLEEKGLAIKNLDCRKGKPVLQKSRLEQQLVDIKT